MGRMARMTAIGLWRSSGEQEINEQKQQEKGHLEGCVVAW